MAGNTTDATIDSIMVLWNGQPFVQVEIEHDGVNLEPVITAYLVFSETTGSTRVHLETQYTHSRF